MLTAYKLFTRRKDGSLGPLFIDRRLRVPLGRWMKARAVRTRGFAFRPGWHATSEPVAPHLKPMPNRVWCRVSIKGVVKHLRPKEQGGLWFIAKQLRVEEVLA